MKLVYINNHRPVTDSLTIAETFGKRHSDVLRSIENMECSADFTERNFALSDYQDSTGRTHLKYLLTQDGFSFLVMGYTGSEAARFKEMYINEFNHMREELSKPKLPQNYKEALIALVEEVEKVERLEAKVLIDAPKVALYDTAMSANNNMAVGRIAKMLDVGPNKLFKFLRDQKVLMSSNIPYQTYIDRGYFVLRQYTLTHLTQGLENKTQTLVTPKGLAWIHNMLKEKGLTA